MKIILFLIIFFSFPVPIYAYTMVSYIGHSYTLTNTSETWAHSEAEAVAAGDNLLTIEEESPWRTATFKNLYRSGNPTKLYNLARIGYYFNNDASIWEWIKGESVTYYNDIFWPKERLHASLYLAQHLSPGTWNANPYHEQDTDVYPKDIIGLFPLVRIPPAILLLGAGLMGMIIRGRTNATNLNV